MHVHARAKNAPAHTPFCLGLPGFENRKAKHMTSGHPQMRPLSRTTALNAPTNGFEIRHLNRYSGGDDRGLLVFQTSVRSKRMHDFEGPTTICVGYLWWSARAQVAPPRRTRSCAGGAIVQAMRAPTGTCIRRCKSAITGCVGSSFTAVRHRRAAAGGKTKAGSTTLAESTLQHRTLEGSVRPIATASPQTEALSASEHLWAARS